MRVLVVGAGMYVTGRGTGGYGTVLPSILQASRSVEIDGVTVCSPTEERGPEVRRVAGELNALLGTRVEVGHRLAGDIFQGGRVESGYDCAILAVPDHLHFELARSVLRAGVHCLVVKPLVPTLAEARELVRLAEEAGVHGAVEFHKRFDESNRIVRRMVRDGTLGCPAYATVEYSQRISVPLESFRSWASRTNIFQYLGVHYVDLLRFLTGYRPLRAMAAGRRGILAAQGIDTWDSIHAMVLWEGDDPGGGAGSFVSQFAVGWIDPRTTTAMSDQRYTLVGSEGRVECDQKNRGLNLVTARSGSQAVNPYFSEFLSSQEPHLEFQGYGHRSIESFLRDVRDIQERRIAVRDLQGRRPTFRESLASTAVIEAVRDSLDHGSTWRDVDAAS